MPALERSAIFSLSEGVAPAAPANEGRAAIARLVCASGARDCFVHRITAASASLTLNAAVIHGEHATIELPFGLTVAGTLVRGDAGAIRFQFDQPMDVVGALAHALAALPAERRQLPRIELRQRLCIRYRDQVDFAWTRDLSPAGLGIETQAQLAAGDVVEVTLDGLRPLRGEIRWVKPGHAGIAHDSEIGWQILMPWLRRIASRRPIAPGAPDDTPLGAVKNAIHIRIASQIRAGSSWWNAQITALSDTLVAFESDHVFVHNTRLWLSLPRVGGWPIRVIECDGNRHIAEFTLPLRPHEMRQLARGARGR